MNLHQNILLILVIVCFPIFFLLVSPLFLVRFLLSKIPGRPKSLGRILSPFSAVYHATSLLSLTDSTNSNVICVSCKICGKFQTEEFENFIYEKIIFAKDDSNRLLFPEFQQYIASWLGFSCWKWEKHFSIKNHITVLSGTSDGYNDVDDLKMKFLSQKLRPKRSPWSILIVEEDKSYTMVLQMDHAMADGTSLITAFLCSNTDSNRKGLYKPKFAKTTFAQQVVQKLTFPVRLFQELSYLGAWKRQVPRLIPLENLPKLKDGKEPSIYVKTSKLLSITLVKEVAQVSGSSFSGVIIAGITGGIRRYLLEKKISVPEKFVSLLPVPVGHNVTENLTNNHTFSEVVLPLGEKDETRRLLHCHEAFLTSKSSTIIAFNWIGGKAIGSLFTSWIKAAFSTLPTNPLSISIFPGPFEKVSFNGSRVQEIYFHIFGPVLWFLPMIGVFTYDGGIKISLAASDTNLGTEKDVEYMLKCIEQEFDSMLHHGVV